MHMCTNRGERVRKKHPCLGSYDPKLGIYPKMLVVKKAMVTQESYLGLVDALFESLTHQEINAQLSVNLTHFHTS